MHKNYIFLTRRHEDTFLDNTFQPVVPRYLGHEFLAASLSRECSRKLHREYSRKLHRECSRKLHREYSRKLHRECSRKLHGEYSRKLHRECSVKLHRECSRKLHRECSVKLHRECSVKLHRECSVKLHEECSVKLTRNDVYVTQMISLWLVFSTYTECMKICLSNTVPIQWCQPESRISMFQNALLRRGILLRTHKEWFLTFGVWLLQLDKLPYLWNCG